MKGAILLQSFISWIGGKNLLKKDLNEQFQTDIQRAARFFMLIKCSYAAKGKNYVCAKKNISAMISYLKDIEVRLSCVCIENKDFQELIKAFENKKTLLFLDPPYYGAEKFYSIQFTKEDHIRLFEAIRNTKNKFILTYNDCDFIHSLYADYRIELITRHNNLTTKFDSGQKYTELIIRNY